MSVFNNIDTRRLIFNFKTQSYKDDHEEKFYDVKEELETFMWRIMGDVEYDEDEMHTKNRSFNLLHAVKHHKTNRPWTAFAFTNGWEEEEEHYYY